MTPARQEKFVLGARMLTWPLTILANTLIGVLIWIYLTDRTDNKEFQRDMRVEIREVKEKAQDFREVISVKIATMSATCCSEIRTKPIQDQLGEANEKSKVDDDAVSGSGLERVRGIKLSFAQCAKATGSGI